MAFIFDVDGKWEEGERRAEEEKGQLIGQTLRHQCRFPRFPSFAFLHFSQTPSAVRYSSSCSMLKQRRLIMQSMSMLVHGTDGSPVDLLHLHDRHQRMQQLFPSRISTRRWPVPETTHTECSCSSWCVIDFCRICWWHYCLQFTSLFLHLLQWWVNK